MFALADPKRHGNMQSAIILWLLVTTFFATSTRPGPGHLDALEEIVGGIWPQAVNAISRFTLCPVPEPTQPTWPPSECRVRRQAAANGVLDLAANDRATELLNLEAGWRIQ